MGTWLKVGDRAEIEIVDVAFGGDGVGRVADGVLFVPFTVDGDTMEIEVTEVRKRYARGRLCRIITPSRHRVPPACTDYARCGGCRMQHIAYGHQLELKGRQIAEIFRRIAQVSCPPLEPPIPSPLPFGWRGKAEFHLVSEQAGPRRAGLMAMASHELIEVERCGIVAESINEKYRAFRKALQAGGMRVPGERQIIWSDEPGEPPTEIFAGPGQPPDVTRIVRGVKLTVPYRGFFQANTALVGELADQVAGLCGLTGGETVIDAYGGAGLFSLFLGPRAGRLYGVEGDRDAVRCARINLLRAGLAQAEFLHGDVGEILGREFAARRRRADVVILDPPRDGCGKGVLDGVAALHPDRIVYISCNPATQARDVRLLAGRGYRLVRLQPLDMFPQTAHIEVIALLTQEAPAPSAAGKSRSASVGGEKRH
ncbi:MAG: class I SAM-dependent RNA methyltransferase [Deltaproteobacteria bacterium]|nr:class I SAM-dependent RNA methyltransferase [Deltaproteobacteria bacterium]